MTRTTARAHRVRRALTAALIVIPTTVLMAPTASAGAHGLPDTRGFWVHNISQRTLVLSSIGTVAYPDGTYAGNLELPPVGWQIAPGMQADFELEASSNNNVTMVWDALDLAGQPINEKIPMTLTVGDANVRYSEATASSTLLVDAGGQDIYVKDQPGTTVEIQTGSSGAMLTQQEGADLIRRLCDLDGVTCQFTLDGTRQEASQPIIVEGPYANYTCKPITLTVGNGTTRSLSASWDVSVSVDTTIGEMVDVSLKTSYGQTTTSTATFATTDTITIDPGWQGSFSSEVPVWRNAGSFRAVTENTTWTVQMTIDSPRDGDMTLTPGPTTTRVTPTEAATVPVNCP